MYCISRAMYHSLKLPVFIVYFKRAACLTRNGRNHLYSTYYSTPSPTSLCVLSIQFRLSFARLFEYHVSISFINVSTCAKTTQLDSIPIDIENGILDYIRIIRLRSDRLAKLRISITLDDIATRCCVNVFFLCFFCFNPEQGRQTTRRQNIFVTSKNLSERHSVLTVRRLLQSRYL